MDISKNNTDKKISSIISKTSKRDGISLNRIKRKDHIDELTSDGHDRQVIIAFYVICSVVKIFVAFRDNIDSIVFS